MVLELWFCIRCCHYYCYTTRLNINNSSLGQCKVATSHSTSTYARCSGLPKSQNQSVTVPFNLRTGKPSVCRVCSTSLATQPKRLWIEPYLKRETLGIAIFRHLHRLIQNKVAAQENNNGDDEKPPAYSMIPSATPLAKELSKLRGAYWEHRNRLSRYDITRSKKGIAAEELVLFRQHRDQHGRPYAWVFDRKRCAARGGCCGRMCGCCETSASVSSACQKRGWEEKSKLEYLGIVWWSASAVLVVYSSEAAMCHTGIFLQYLSRDLFLLHSYSW